MSDIRKRRRVAVLGAGITGCCTALYLARGGIEVSLYDREEGLIQGASRWNEGKIHLGFLYSGDPELHTARELLAGGLQFRPILEDLLDTRLRYVSTSRDLYLVHRDSIVSPQDTGRYFDALTAMIREHPQAGVYLDDLRLAETTRLGRRELESLVDTSRIQGGFSTPEKSVCTQEIADLLAAAVEAEPLIRSCLGTGVTGARRQSTAGRDGFHILTSKGEQGPFSTVVNALWAGRPVVDQSLELNNVCNPSIRFRVSLFVKTGRALDIPCAVMCTGPFGDIKNYGGQKFYLSWYSSGLIYSSDGITVPDLSRIGPWDEKRIIDETFENLALHIPSVQEIRECATHIAVEGGWVFANGRGALSDPDATVHKRDQVGIHQTGQWFSVDTGKYSIAPWLAREVSTRILEG